MKCNVNGCDNTVWGDSEPRKSKSFCKEHIINKINVKCSVCNCDITSRPDRYLDHITNNKPFICRKCSASINGKKFGSNNFNSWIGSDAQKEHLKKLNSSDNMKKIRINNIKKAWKNEDFKKKQSERLKAYNNSKEGKEHNKKMLDDLHKKRTEEFNKNLNNICLQNNIDINNIRCDDCNKKLNISSKYELYNKIKSNKPIICHSCSARRIGNEYGKKNFIVWAKSEECLNHIKELGKKYNYTYKDNFKDWIGSDAQKEHLRRINIIGKIKSMKKFYESKFDVIRFNSIDKEVCFDDIINLKGVPGVWAKFTENGICLDVSQTKDIGKEMFWSIRVFDKNKNLTDEEINNMNRVNLRKKYRNMYNDSNGKIVFKVIAINIENSIDRKLIEAQYAHDNKAKYWYPAPGQSLN